MIGPRPVARTDRPSIPSSGGGLPFAGQAAAKQAVPYPVRHEPVPSDFQAPIPDREFFVYPAASAPVDLDGVVEELAFDDGHVRQVSAYSIRSGAGAAPGYGAASALGLAPGE